MISASWAIFSKEAKKELDEIESRDYEEEAVALGRAKIETLCAQLKAEGHVRGIAKWAATLSFCGLQITCEMDFAGDEFDLLFWARVRTLWLNGRLGPTMRYERLLVDKMALEDVPTEIVVPQFLSDEVTVLEQNIEEHCDGCASLVDMCNAVLKNQKEFMEHHCSAALDVSFCEQKAAEVMRATAPLLFEFVLEYDVQSCCCVFGCL